MGDTPDELRTEIEGTRADMSATLDAMGEKMSPRQVAKRQAGRVTGRVASVRDSVMGTVHRFGDDGTGGMDDRTRGMPDRLGQAPDLVKERTQGNPLAAGIIAFGAGLLAASLLPPTDPERRLASAVGERAQPAVARAQGAAEEMKGQLQESAQESAGHLKDAAAERAQRVKEDASSSAQELAGRTREAAQDVRSQAQVGGAGAGKTR